MTRATLIAIGAALLAALAGFIGRVIYNWVTTGRADIWPALNFAAGWAIGGAMCAVLYVR